MEENNTRQEQSRKLMKPIRFLEDKISSFFSLAKNRFDSIEEDMGSVRDSGLGLSEDVSDLKKKNYQLELQLKQLKEEQNVYADKSELYAIQAGVGIAQRKLQEGLGELRAHVEKSLESIQEQLSGYSGLKSKVVELESLYSEFKDKMELFRLSQDDQSIDAKDTQDQLVSEVNALMKAMQLRVEKQDSELSSVSKSVEMSEKYLKDNSEKLSKSLKETLENSAVHLDAVIFLADEKRKLLEDKVEGFQEDVLKSAQSGKYGKNVDDFMKQVGYNAKQIEKIQKRLEGE